MIGRPPELKSKQRVHANHKHTSCCRHHETNGSPMAEATSVRLVCGSLVRLPRTDAPLTSGPSKLARGGLAAAALGAIPLNEKDCTDQWLLSNPPYISKKV